MKVTGIYVYPIKSLRGIALADTLVGPQGVQLDRRFMLLTAARSKGDKKKQQQQLQLQKMQLSGFPECALFSQELELGGPDGDVVVVRYHPRPREDEKVKAADTPDTKSTSRVAMSPVEHPPLRVPLHPALASLRPLAVDLHGSPAAAYRMGDPYDAWFSACFGMDVVLAYIGDGRRAVLGETLKPKSKTTAWPAQPIQSAANTWTGLLSYLMAAWTALLALFGIASKLSPTPRSKGDDPWLAFSDCAPLLITSEASLRNVSARMAGGVEVPMYKFRPNIVVDGGDDDGAAWDEDYWAELTVGGRRAHEHDKSTTRLLLTSNCARCTSLNVDYTTGATAQGELGHVLKRLAKDRRVDTGIKYSPVFGRYAFLDGEVDDDDDNNGAVRIAVGDDVTVTKRNTERTVWDWPGL